MVEAWGRGIPLILEKEPNVKFGETAGIFIASFRRPSFSNGIVEPKEKSSLGTTHKTTVKTTGKTTVKILELIRANNRVTRQELAQTKPNSG